MRPTLETLTTPYRVLSLGAGVQSSTIALMMMAGEIEPCELAIFADTGAEPKRVYEWLAWLRTRLSFPVAIVQQGAGLTDRLERACRGECYVGNPPMYTLNGGLLKRKCTRDFKLAPIFREMQRTRAGRPVVQIIGFSWDERQRAANLAKRRKRYVLREELPLIDRQLTRQDCLRWMATHDYPTLPRSACVYCPYRCDLEWRRLRDTDPDGWAEACRMDALMRLNLPGIRPHGKYTQQQCFVHRSCVPLAEVDLSTDLERGQQLLPGAKCATLRGAA
jgi:hypothetical protein